MLISIFPPQYKTTVMDSLCRGIFQKDYTRHNTFLDKILRENRRLSRKSVGSFVFLGVVYGRAGNTVVRPLSDGLKAEMGEHVKRLTEFKINQENPTKSFISSALNICQTPADLFLVLPQAIHQHLPVEVSQHRTVAEPTLSQEQVDTFMQQNQKTLQLLKEKLMLNLIL